MTYTDEVIRDMVELYTKTPTLETVGLLARKYDKPERSIISKLSALGVYKKKVYVSKTGEPPVKKEEYIERIANLLDIDTELLESMEKVTKYALILLEKKIEILTNSEK